MKIVSINEIIKRIEEKYPNQPFEIIKFTRVTQPFIIKCLKCGKIKEYSSFGNFMNSKRKGICLCYNEKNNETKHNNCLKEIENILQEQKDIEFLEYWYKEDTKKNMIKVKCCFCEQDYSKPFSEFKKNYKCPYCKGRELLNTTAVKALLKDNYDLLSDYQNTNEKVLVRHKSCGFIWKTYVKKILKTGGCPKCNRKRSKGEQKIASFLIEQNIDFIPEKIFEWQSNKRRRYDFYLPAYNLIIEFNGIQHYEETNYFRLNLKEQQQVDLEKFQEAKKAGLDYLIIKYTDFDNINNILTNWFNDYPAREYTISD